MSLYMKGFLGISLVNPPLLHCSSNARPLLRVGLQERQHEGCCTYNHQHKSVRATPPSLGLPVFVVNFSSTALKSNPSPQHLWHLIPQKCHKKKPGHRYSQRAVSTQPLRPGKKTVFDVIL